MFDRATVDMTSQELRPYYTRLAQDHTTQNLSTDGDETMKFHGGDVGS